MNSVTLRFKFFFLLLLGVMLLGTVGFPLLEGMSFLDAFYFSIVTIATVGYGDIVPFTQAGKMLAVALIICGVGTFLGVIVNATETYLAKRESEQRKEKLRMVMGLFFSEFGTDLLTRLCRCDPTLDEISQELRIHADWSSGEFSRAKKALKSYSSTIDTTEIDLRELRDDLEKKGDLFLRLFENPNLLEHESFTELLRAILHLKEELLHREDFAGLPTPDLDHLAGDVRRVYGALLPEWLDHMRYLKQNYPYLFSLALRLNPFDREASPVVQSGRSASGTV